MLEVRGVADEVDGGQSIDRSIEWQSIDSLRGLLAAAVVCVNRGPPRPGRDGKPVVTSLNRPPPTKQQLDRITTGTCWWMRAPSKRRPSTPSRYICARPCVYMCM